MGYFTCRYIPMTGKVIFIHLLLIVEDNPDRRMFGF